MVKLPPNKKWWWLGGGLWHCFTHSNWLVLSTPLKNISQLGWLFPIYGKIKNVPNHQPAYQLPMFDGRCRPMKHHDQSAPRLSRVCPWVWAPESPSNHLEAMGLGSHENLGWDGEIAIKWWTPNGPISTDGCPQPPSEGWLKQEHLPIPKCNKVEPSIMIRLDIWSDIDILGHVTSYHHVPSTSHYDPYVHQSPPYLVGFIILFPQLVFKITSNGIIFKNK